MTEGPDLSKNPPEGQPQQPHQNPYGGQPYPPYGAATPPYGQYGQYGQYGTVAPGQVPYGYPVVTPDHPQATTVLVLGIIGIVACSLTGPFAWVMGNRVIREIDANPQHYGGRSNANIGRILGIVATALMGVALLVVVLAFVGVFAGLATA